MRIGVLGAGWTGNTHTKAYVTMPDVEIAGIVGRREAKVQELADALDVPGFTDPWKILDDETVDAVDVCYPTFVCLLVVTGGGDRQRRLGSRWWN